MKLVAWALLLLAGAVAHAVERGALVEPRVPELARMPGTLGPLETVGEIPFDERTLGELPPERWTYRAVRGAHGEGAIWVAYYLRSRRWSGRPHDVAACYRTLGWDERDAARTETPEGRPVHVRRFARDGEEVVVVHWLERPRAEAASSETAAAGVLGRLFELDGLRQDVVSVYLEFPLDAAHPEELLGAADAASTALHALWRAGETD
jgi:hypothetical protein